MSDSDELNKTGNPIMDKFLSSTDTPEKAMAGAEAMHAAAEQFNSGAPIPRSTSLISGSFGMLLVA